MQSNLLWLLFGLAVVGAAAWRLVVSSRKARDMRAAREQAMAIALAEAQKAAKENLARRQAQAGATVPPPAITRTITRPPAAAPVRPPAPVRAEAPLTDAQVAARAEAQRIALEAARRAKAQKAARVEEERRAALEAQALVEAARAPAPAPAPAPQTPPPAVTRLAARPPVVSAPAPAPVAPPPSPAAKTPAETVILMVDDSKMVRVKTSRLLEGHAYRVVTAVDGADAVRQLETCRPDLVITDVDMPNLDGFGLARHLRSGVATAHIPIVMITSAEDRHREPALREGVGLVLGKPYPEAELLAHIRSFRFASGATA